VRVKYVEEWNKKLANDKKLRTYKLFKTNFVYENYLNDIRNVTDRKNFTKLRISSHNLMIEKGRHMKIQANERFCPFCINIIENEEHFLLSCLKYIGLRSNLFTSIETKVNNFASLNNESKLIYMFTSEKDIVREISKFCTCALLLRDES